MPNRRAPTDQEWAYIRRALSKLESVNQAFLRAQDNLDAAVRDARRYGATWTQLAQIFHTTRSAAQQRFRDIGEDQPLW
jgi:Tfp pilus assembly protein PilF